MTEVQMNNSWKLWGSADCGSCTYNRAHTECIKILIVHLSTPSSWSEYYFISFFCQIIHDNDVQNINKLYYLHMKRYTFTRLYI